MSNNTYIALTLGPIYRTLQTARSTKELWAASYLFSYITEKITKKLREKGIKDAQFVMPYAPEIRNEKLSFGAGIFPDRIIFKKTKTTDLQTTTDAVDATLDKVSEIVKGTLVNKGLVGKDTDIESYIKAYFQIYVIEKEVSEGKNAILEISPYLDTIELQSHIVQTETEVERPHKEDSKKTKKDKIERRNYLEMYFEHINGSCLARKVFGDNSLNKGSFSHIDGFPSIPDIATIALYRQSPFDIKKEADDTQFYEQLRKCTVIEPLLNHYHRYICIVHADGDNIGKAISHIKDNNFLPFSEKLYDFGFEAAKLIDNYGGKPVYIGGDDLLFFAPIQSNNGSIFTLIEQLNQKFNDLNFEVGKDDIKPTLSFGISISYFKFPMFETLEISRDLLFDKAKNYKAKSGDEKNAEALEISRDLLFDKAKNYKVKSGNEKNAIAFRVLKHSGQYWETILQKDTLLYTQFIALLNNTSISDTALSSLTYQLNKSQPLLDEIWKNSNSLVWKTEADDTQNPFRHFFKNYFNEGIHQGDSKNYIDMVARLLWLCYQQCDEAQANEVLYALLRTLNFLSPKKTNINE